MLPVSWIKSGIALNRMLYSASVTLIVIASPVSYGQTSSLIDLGTGVRAYGINVNGDITGCTTASGPTHAFIFSAGTMSDLGTLGGTNSCGYALNKNRQVTGYADTAAGASHAFLYDAGAMSDLGTIKGAKTSAGTSINSNGEVVGYSWQLPPYAVPDILTHIREIHIQYLPGVDSGVYAFSYSHGSVTQLVPGDVSPTTAFATVVNDAGSAAAVQLLNCGMLCPTATTLRIDNGIATDAVTSQALSEIYILIPTGISENGDIAAYGEDGGAFIHGTVLTKVGAQLDLGRNTTAFGMNAGGQVVGSGGVIRAIPDYTGVTKDTSALIFNDGVATDLNVPGAIPSAINDGGSVILNHAALDHAYVLSPSDIAVVPSGLTFGNVPIGKTSNTNNAFCGACIVTVTNHTTAAIAVGNISVTGSGFAQTNNCPVSLAPAAQCVVNVTFTPNSYDLTYGQLSVAAGGIQYATVLRGAGAPVVTMTASSSDVNVGDFFSIGWTVTSASPADCVETGGAADVGASDNWRDSLSRTTTGAAQIAESVAGTFTFTLTCTAQSQFSRAQQVVVVHAKSASGGSASGGSASGGGGSGGGGAIDRASILAMLALWSMRSRLMRRRGSATA